jgi:chromosome segregation ATPase
VIEAQAAPAVNRTVAEQRTGGMAGSSRGEAAMLFEQMQLEMSAAKSELVHLSQKLDSTRTTDMRSSVAALEQQLTHQTAGLESQVQALQHRRHAEEQAASSRCAQLEAQLAQQSAQCHSYAQQLAEMQAQHSRDTASVGSVAKEIAQARREQATSKDRMRELEAAARRHQLERTEASAATAALRAEAQEAQRELEDHRDAAANTQREDSKQLERYRAELASSRKEHAEQLEKHCDELASVRRDHAEHLEGHRDELACMQNEHVEQLQRTSQIEAQLSNVQSALSMETERTIEMQLALRRVEAERDTAMAARDHSLRMQTELTVNSQASEQERQLLRRKAADLQEWSSDLAAENELLRAQLVELKQTRIAGLQPTPTRVWQPAHNHTAEGTPLHNEAVGEPPIDRHRGVRSESIHARSANRWNVVSVLPPPPLPQPKHVKRDLNRLI